MQPDQPMNHTVYSPLGTASIQHKRSQSEVLQQLPLLGEVLRHIDARIDALMTPETISDDILLDPAKYMHEAFGRKAALKLLRNEKTYIQNKIDSLPSE